MSLVVGVVGSLSGNPERAISQAILTILIGCPITMAIDIVAHVTAKRRSAHDRRS